MTLLLVGLPLGVGLPLAVVAPVAPGRDEAARLAREELAKVIYRQAQPSLAERALRWALTHLLDLLNTASGVSPGGYLGLVVTALLVVVVVVALRLQVGPLARRTRADRPLFSARALTAAEHRAAADRHAATGAWAEALRERLRAVVRSLEERAILDERPGRTADEAATDAGRLLPDCAADLRQVAALFDDVWYGGRAATPAADAAARALDLRVGAARVSAARPVVPAGNR